MNHRAQTDRAARVTAPAAAVPRHEASPRGEGRLAQLIDDSPRQRAQRQTMAALLAPARPGVLKRVNRRELLKGSNKEAFQKLLAEAGVQEGAVGNAFEVMSAAHRPEDGAQKFVQAQVAYQDLLVNGLGIPKATINAFHRSAGFEYEFSEFYRQGHPEEQGAEAEVLPSHVLLAYSAPCGAMFDKRFRLETDSRNALEMVTPPFFVLVSAEGNGLLKRINDLYGEDQAAVKTLRRALTQQNASPQQPSRNSEEEKSPDEPPKEPLIQDRLNHFDSLGFGSGWSWVFAGEEKLCASAQGGKHAGVLAQVNISLDPDEIMALAAEMITISKGPFQISGSQSMEGTPTSLFEEVFKRLGGSEGANAPLRGPLAFLARSVSNIVGIPSILYRSTFRARPEEGNFATSIKETLGLWVKDFPHLVIQDYFVDKREASQGFVECVNHGRGGIRETVLRDVQRNVGVLKQYRAKDLALRHGNDAVQSRLVKERIKRVAETEKLHPLPPQSDGAAFGLALQARKAAVAAINGPFLIYAGQERAAQQQLLQAAMNTLDADVGQFEAMAMAELDAMIERLLGALTSSSDQPSSSAAARPEAPPRGEAEVFGDGLGVRKETFLPPAKGTSLRVAEIRSARDLSQVEPVINKI